MKIVWNVIGAIGLLVGALWILQGMGIAPGSAPSFFHAKVTWIGNGAFLIAFAAGLLVWANRAPTPPKA